MICIVVTDGKSGKDIQIIVYCPPNQRMWEYRYVSLTIMKQPHALRLSKKKTALYCDIKGMSHIMRFLSWTNPLSAIIHRLDHCVPVNCQVPLHEYFSQSLMIDFYCCSLLNFC